MIGFSDFIAEIKQADLYKHGVYKVYHLYFPSDIYIGSAARLPIRRRFYQHYISLKNGKHHSKRLQSHVTNYGTFGLRFEIIEICSAEEAKHREQFYLDTLQPNCNSTKSAFDSTGYKHSPENIIKMALAKKDYVVSAKTRSKISKAMKGKRPKNIETLWSKEARAKVGDKLRGKKRDPKLFDSMVQPVYQYSKAGVLIKVHRSMTDASRECNIDRATINHVALGNRKTAGGFVWKYAKAHGLSESRLTKSNKRA